MDRTGFFLLFVALSTIAWCVVVPVFALLFSWTEYVSGINWLYLPHGLRMMLVLLFGVAGALGISIGSHVLRWAELDGLTSNPSVDFPMALVSGLAAYCAVLLTLREWPGKGLLPRIGQGIPAIDGRRLVLLAFVSAILNSGGHIAVRTVFGREQQPINDDFLIMLVGDFFGALVLLYTLKRIVLFFEKSESGVSPL
ncbi:MAG: hypothetical protein FJ178_07405 [Gammaproteobacteria bacterium]|nr:hypothetical protein [Gammaproteobacteria bacterium]